MQHRAKLGKVCTFHLHLQHCIVELCKHTFAVLQHIYDCILTLLIFSISCSVPAVKGSLLHHKVCEQICIQSREPAQPGAEHTAPLPSSQDCLQPELYLTDKGKGRVTAVRCSPEVLALRPSALFAAHSRKIQGGCWNVLFMPFNIQPASCALIQRRHIVRRPSAVLKTVKTKLKNRWFYDLGSALLSVLWQVRDAWKGFRGSIKLIQICWWQTTYP